MQTFHFVHDYQAPAIATIFESYFDPEFALAQDREVDIIERTVLELTDGASELVRVCRLVPKRQLPALFRPLVAGELPCSTHAVTATPHFSIRAAQQT